MNIESEALKANLKETRVAVEIEEKYRIIPDIFQHYQGLRQSVSIFLEELANPMRNWPFIISEAHKYAFDQLHIIRSHKKGIKALELFLDIFHTAMEENTSPKNNASDISREAADQLLQFLQKIIRDSGKDLIPLLPVINASFRRMNSYNDDTLFLFAKSFYRLNRIAGDLVKKVHGLTQNKKNIKDIKTLQCKLQRRGKDENSTSGKNEQDDGTKGVEKDNARDFDWHDINALLLRYHETGVKSWLNEKDPLSWFKQEIEEESLDDSVTTLFEPISHTFLENELKKLKTGISTLSMATSKATEKLVAFPEFNEIMDRYARMPATLLKAGKSSRQGNHWKVIFMFHILNIPGLSMIHMSTLQDINKTLRWLIEVENNPYIQRIISQAFTILKLRSEQFPETTLNCILNMGKGVYNTDNGSLVQFFIDCVIDAGFQMPSVKGVSRNWQIKDNSAHLLNIRVWMALISLNPQWSIRLISHLIIYLSTCGVLIKDTDLFPRDITTLLNSPVEPVYNLIKQLTRLFPVYYNEIGAEGSIRDKSTRIDEICAREDRLIHFYRKRIHVESSNRIISMTEAIMRFWQTRKKSCLNMFIPPELMAELPEKGIFIDGLHSDMIYLGKCGIKIPEDLLHMSGTELRHIISRNPSCDANAKDHERLMLLITLYKLLSQKYSPAFTEINKYLEQVNTAQVPHLDILKDALAEQERPDTKIKWKLQKLLNYLRLLQKELLSTKRYKAKEDIFKKRHFAADIPSLYGSYHERKFDALGLTFRLESLVNPLFEDLIEEIDLSLITKLTVHKIRNRLLMFYQALKLDGISSTEYEFQMDLLTHSLEVQGFTFTQYLDIFQAFHKAVKNIINDYFHTTHQENLDTVLDRVPMDVLVGQYAIQEETFDIKNKTAEIFFRERMSSALGLQQLDNFLTRIQNTLFQQAQRLPSEHLQKLMMYDSKRIITSLNHPKSWVLGAMDLGNKGNNLLTLSSCGLPVPPGFIITTEAFRYRELIDYYQPALMNFKEQVITELNQLEKCTGKTFGSPENPLLLSVRSGSVISQPGMMDTLIDVGINEDIASGIAEKTGNAWLAWDNYRRFVQCFGMIQGIKRDAFDAIMEHYKKKWFIPYKHKFSGGQMKTVALAYRDKFKNAGLEISTNPLEQLFLAIKLVFDSWNAPRARAYRKIIGLSEDWGTSITVQQMVFGNRSENAGTGVVLTHDPRSPRNQISLWGDFTRASQGEDVVAGLVNTFPISIAQQEREMRNTDTTLESHFPEIYKGLLDWATEMVNKRRWSPQEIEFTFESEHLNDLYILQSRDLGIRERKIKPEFVSEAKAAAISETRYLGNGIGVSGGAMSGRLVFTLKEIRKWRKQEPQTPLILVRSDTVPDDIREIHAADGLLTARGGMTSHASIVAYRLDKTCVVGYRSMVCKETEKKCIIDDIIFSSGDFLSIDGHEGAVFQGAIPIIN